MQDHTPSRHKVFDFIYSTDLVYKPQCWKLCEAHCCNFFRYKSGPSKHVHEIPLLPGEWQYMSSKGYLDQYKDAEHTVLKVSLNVGVLSYEAIKIPTTGCPCDHWRRPTVCRLYPLAPRYDLERGFVGVDSTFSLMEIAEEFLGVPRACQVDQVPFHEVEKFIAISKAIETEPVMMFRFMVLDLLKTFLRAGLRDNKDQIVDEDSNFSDPAQLSNAFELIQLAFLRGVVIDWRQAKMALEELGARFKKMYGPAFRLGDSELPGSCARPESALMGSYRAPDRTAAGAG